MATALSGHIDDRDGSPTRLETSAPCVHTSLRTSQAFGPLWRKLRRARALSGLGAISNPDRRDADGYLIATARPDNPAEPRPHLRRPRTHPAHRSRGRGTHHVLQIVAMSRPWRRRPVSLLRRPGRSQRRGQPVRDHPGPASPTHQLERRSPARNERGARRTGGARLSRGPAGRPRNAAGTPSEVATHEERRQRPQLVACRALQRSVRQRGLRRRDVMACLGQRRRPAARRLDEYGRLLRVRS